LLTRGTASVENDRKICWKANDSSWAILPKSCVEAGCGLAKKKLPECMGVHGAVSFHSVRDMCIRYRWVLPQAGNRLKNTCRYTVAQCNLSEQEKVEGTQNGILNSRRKRERRKIEGTVLHEQVEELGRTEWKPGGT
jgi:hypothetical protein